MIHSSFKPLRRQSGLGLVELMVGVVIAMMASLAIFQTFAVSEEQRRSTSSGSEGLQAGTLAMSQFKRAIQNAGYGMVMPTDVAIKRPARLVNPGGLSTIINSTPADQEFLTGCTTPGGLRVAPIIVTGGGNGFASDRIVVMQGNSSLVPIPAKLVVSTPAGATDVTISSTYGFAVNDWVLIYEQDSASNPGNARPVQCTFARVINLPGAPNLANAVIRLNVGTAATYTKDARVANLGQNPQAIQISVVGNRLQSLDLAFAGAQPQVLADNVVSMKVQVGIDVGNDDIIDEWINPPALPGNWLNPPNPSIDPVISALPVAPGARSLNQIKALRLGLLIRSPQFERANRTTNTCEITGAGPFRVLEAVAGDNAQRVPAMPSSGDYNFFGNDRCFRYNTVTSVVPLRNMIVSDL